MTPKQYIEMIPQGPEALGDAVSKLSNTERKALYNALVGLKCDKLVKPLWYNYETQELIV